MFLILVSIVIMFSFFVLICCFFLFVSGYVYVLVIGFVVDKCSYYVSL